MKLRASVSAVALMASGMSMGVSAPAQAQLDPYIGQMMAFGGNFCPRGWSTAEGQILSISQNTALFSLLGTYYGGDGITTFGLPDLRGRAPIGQGNAPGLSSYQLGQMGGSTEFTLTTLQMPTHTHTGTIAASGDPGDTNNPIRNSFAASTNGANVYLDGNPAINNMHPDTLRINPAGGGLPVNKVSPYTVVQWCVALVGLYPSRN